jgi:fibronectin type 3 domain-containing protein
VDDTSTELKSKTGYCYTISAVDVAGNESAQSTSACTVTGASAPPTPTGLTPTLLAGPLVNLTWTASAGAVVYRIYRDGVTSSALSATGTTLTDTTVLANKVYCYTVSAVDGSGNESAQSGAVCIATGAAPPPTPTGFTAAGAAGPQVNLAWTASAGAVVYRIYRNGASAPTLLSIGVTATDTVATGIVASTVYSYTISAVDGPGNESGKSSQVCTKTP